MFPAAVVVADEDRAARAQLSALLRRLDCVVLHASTGEEAVAATDGRRPDAAVIDVRLPDTTGYELCRELRDRYGDELPIVLLSADRTEASDRVAGLLLGADEYLAKPVDPDEFLARMRRLLARSRARARVLDGPASRLTRRELEVLTLLADGLRQADIARRLVISPKTVGTHIQRILEKLEVHSRAQAVALAHREGIVNGRQAAHQGAAL